jgi:hypothetical protein
MNATGRIAAGRRRATGERQKITADAISLITSAMAIPQQSRAPTGPESGNPRGRRQDRRRPGHLLFHTRKKICRGRNPADEIWRLRTNHLCYVLQVCFGRGVPDGRMSGSQ